MSIMYIPQPARDIGAAAMMGFPDDLVLQRHSQAAMIRSCPRHQSLATLRVRREDASPSSGVRVVK